MAHSKREENFIEKVYAKYPGTYLLELTKDTDTNVLYGKFKYRYCTNETENQVQHIDVTLEINTKSGINKPTRMVTEFDISGEGIKQSHAVKVLRTVSKQIKIQKTREKEEKAGK